MAASISGRYAMDSDLEGIRISVEKTIIANSPNFQYMVEIIDETTGAVVKSDIRHINDAVTELINAGGIRLCRPKESRVLQRLIDFAISFAVGRGEENFKFTKNSHRALGWKAVGGMEFYLGNNVINATNGVEVKSDYIADDVINMVQRGTVEEWVRIHNETIAPNVISSIVMIASFAGMFRQRYKKLATDTQLVINIVGPSSTGKTTLVRAAHTAYTSGEEVLGYSTSLNSRIKRLALRNPVVASIDDVLQMSNLKGKKAEDINELIFGLASGVSKDRLGKYGDLRKQEKFDSSVLLTSVETLLDKTGTVDVGQLSRLIELKVDNGTLPVVNNNQTKDEWLKKVNIGLEENCGNAVEEFAYHLVSEEQTVGGFDAYQELLLRRYEEYRSQIQAILILEGMKNTRSANRITLIVLLAELLNFKLGTKYKLKEIGKYLIENAVEKWKSFDENSIDDREIITLNNLGTYLIKHKKYFHQGRFPKLTNLAQVQKTWLGIYLIDDSKNVVFRIPIIKGHDRMGWMLYGVDPQKIFAIENNEMVGDKPKVAKKAVREFLRDMRDKGISSCRPGGLHTKVTMIENRKQQVLAYQFTMPQDIISPKDMEIDSEGGDTAAEIGSIDPKE